MWLAVAVFAVTYVLVSARRLQLVGLDRPAGALLGAVACVLLGVLGPDEALAAIDSRTLLLLFGVMGMGAYLAIDGFFERAAQGLAGWAGTRGRLLGAVLWGSGGLAALVTNDAVCVLGAPLVVALIKRHRLPPVPFLLALATAANTGSVATLVGNPQNMLCASLGGLSYREHLVLVGPVAVAAMAVNHAVLAVLFRRELRAPLEPIDRIGVLTRGSAVTLAVIGLTVVAYLLGADLAWTAAGGLCVLALVHRGHTAEVWQHIDWSVLVFFASLFVVVDGLVANGVTSALFARWPLWTDAGWWRLSFLFLVGSNVVSNVPFILVVADEMATLPDPKLGWELLAVTSTFAGNLTLIGSVANVIVAEKSKEVGGLGFRAHLRVGLPVTVLTTALATAWLVAVGQ